MYCAVTLRPQEGQKPWERRVEKENSRTTVAWNPWVVKANSLPDFADNEWMRMICIGVSNVSDFGVDLAGGQQHKMTARVKAVGY
jgi:glucose-6-phosphate 1-epimerase